MTNSTWSPRGPTSSFINPTTCWPAWTRSWSTCTPSPVFSTIGLEEAGQRTLAFIKSHVPEARTVPLCGNSIGTDRRFLARYLPEIENHLHYRSVDVSTIKELVKRWYPGADTKRPFKAGNHRALGDVHESIAELRFYRERVFVAVDQG
jgi:oligoribonuclease